MDQARMNTDEIDLRELFLRLVLITKRNFWLIAAFFALGTALGTLYYALAPKEYTSEMVLNSDILKESYVDGAGDLLDDMISDKNTVLVSSMLGITPEEVGKIKSINFRNTETSRDKEKEDFFLTVTVKVYDQNVLPALGKGIVGYLENNDFAKSRVEQRKIFYEKLIQKLEEEVASLENFKTSFYSGTAGFLEKNKTGVLMNPTDINARIIELTREKVSYQNELINVRGIEIVQNFVPSVHPSWPKKSISLSAGAFVGLFMVAMLIAFKSTRKLIRLAEENETRRVAP